MLFRPESRLIDFISICSSLDYLSNMIANGCYELISLTRCAFLIPPKPPKTEKSLKKAGKAIDEFLSPRANITLEQRFEDYIDGFESMVLKDQTLTGNKQEINKPETIKEETIKQDKNKSQKHKINIVNKLSKKKLK